MIRPSQATAIAASVPLLHEILVRALHFTHLILKGGPRTVQNPPRLRAKSFGLVPRARTNAVVPASTLRPSPSSSSNPNGALQSGSSNPRPSTSSSSRSEQTPPTSSRRLARLDTPPHQREKRVGNTIGGPVPVIIPRGSKISPYPQSKPFLPTTYPTPDASADTHSAAPKRFEEFPLHPTLLHPLHERFGTTGKTTAIQTLSLRHFLPSFDSPARVLLGAETGSGKTLAYLLPMFSHLKSTDQERASGWDKGEDLSPRALVLTPTHELSRQSTGMAKMLCHHVKLSVVGMSATKYGGVGDRRGAVDVLFGTGAMTRRMLGLASPRAEVTQEDGERKAYLGVERLDWVVIDEADVLFGAAILGLLTSLCR